ncbi:MULTISPECIES: amino acid ABC transporter permease [Micrococcaceae]|jgi:polar amino acid transport system permease protein/polar amino acid transport system substrate-binding protein|uniref:amino acid ABC transporter permease n=1 Tax=Micrococcaceae TaxID=1268 RepID=UPI0025542A82|nr:MULTISPECIES: amino acid ABC transporter permease [Micrococcaceae]MDQ0031557.1 polar amino acid transport system permease protein/polar amino acid transport system substrate-binding protein [Arthrobacter bambusae]MDQ0099781.1 polar amino acid transport system permease protein/polar amino acid transport system substrate-binding protein [Arthrobacter bambusae]
MDFDQSIFLQALTSKEFLSGAVLSLELAAVSQVAATLIGLFVALAGISKSKTLRSLAWAYVWFFRSVPTLLLLLIVWNAAPQIIPALRDNWYSPFLAGFVGLSVVEGAFMAEILRSALLSVDSGQKLAARALGLTPAQTFLRVELPQAIKVALPPTGNEFIGMIKYTSLASVISLQELMTTAQVQVATTFRYAEFYTAALVYYLVIVSAVMVLQHQVEKRYRWVSLPAKTRPRVERVPATLKGL